MGVEVRRVHRDLLLPLRRRVLGVGALKGDLAPASRHWGAFLDGRAVGCASVMDLRGWALRALAVAPDHRRRGIGGLVLRRLCEEVDAPLWCNARLQAVPFYLSAGWRAVGPVFELQAVGPHQRMEWPGSDGTTPAV